MRQSKHSVNMSLNVFMKLLEMWQWDTWLKKGSYCKFK